MSPEMVDAASEQQLLGATRGGSLTWRASLNLVQSVLDYGAKLAVRLAVTPILVGGLGPLLFGVWEILGRLGGYLESADGRSTQALRLVISHVQSNQDSRSKRRWIGSALVVWLCFLPLWSVAGAILIWLAPAITGVPAELHSTVRVAAAILMAGALVGGLAALPESVLRGMNLGYTRMGVQAGLSVVGGVLLAGAIYGDFGLVGVAGAGLLLALLTGLCFWMLVRRHITWFGAERPRRAEVGILLQMSLWVAVGDGVAKLLLASDVIVIGIVMSAASVTPYVLTGYAALLAMNLYALAADAAMPGLAGIIGERDHGRAAAIRRELMAITVLFATAAGATILIWNRSFVNLWVGLENYAGFWVNLLLVLIAVQTAFIRCDAYIIDAALQPGRRVRIAAVAAVVVLALSLVLTWQAGLVGLCIGILLGRVTQMAWYPGLVRRCLGGSQLHSSSWLVRALLVMGMVFAITSYFGHQILLDHWLAWVLATGSTFVVAFAVACRFGLPSDLRSAVLARLLEVGRRAGSHDVSSRPAR